jgi:glycosyltransferase involved in cell wall biosynthesis
MHFMPSDDARSVPPRILLSCSAGPVDKPGTWSGTPSHLLSAFRDAGELDVRIAAAVEPDASDALARRIDTRLRLSHPAVHGPARRWLQAARAQRAARALGCEATLHFGSYDLSSWPTRLPAYLYVDTSYDLWERSSVSAIGLSRWRRHWFRRWERSALRRARHVFTVGQHVADNLVECLGLKRSSVTAVATGRGLISPYGGPKDYSSGRLLTVAKIRPVDKGLPLLLEAFAIARRQLPHLQLTVVGGAAFPGIETCDGVRATGWITDEELQQLYEQASLFVMPATYEPWGLAYLEALACRTPLLGLNGNALPEISSHGRYGFLSERRDAQGFAHDLLAALADPERLRQMGEQGQADCLRRYSWQQTASRIAAHLRADLAATTAGGGQRSR